MGRRFLDDVPRQIRDLRGHLEAGDGTLAERSAHTINGAASAVGARRLAEQAAALERSAKAQDLATARTGCEQLEDAFRQLEAAMESSLLVS